MCLKTREYGIGQGMHFSLTFLLNFHDTVDGIRSSLTIMEMVGANDGLSRIASHKRKKQGARGAVAPLDFWFK